MRRLEDLLATYLELHESRRRSRRIELRHGRDVVLAVKSTTRSAFGAHAADGEYLLERHGLAGGRLTVTKPPDTRALVSAHGSVVTLGDGRAATWRRAGAEGPPLNWNITADDDDTLLASFDDTYSLVRLLRRGHPKAKVFIPRSAVWLGPALVPFVAACCVTFQLDAASRRPTS